MKEQTPEPWLDHLRLTEEQRKEALRAWDENPFGVRQLIRSALTSANPARSFVARMRKGEHLRDHAGAKITGWRFIRGSHSGTYVEDPYGTDPLPPGYQL